jgi:hypothetical protein
MPSDVIRFNTRVAIPPSVVWAKLLRVFQNYSIYATTPLAATITDNVYRSNVCCGQCFAVSVDI